VALWSCESCVACFKTPETLLALVFNLTLHSVGLKLGDGKNNRWQTGNWLSSYSAERFDIKTACCIYVFIAELLVCPQRPDICVTEGEPA